MSERLDFYELRRWGRKLGGGGTLIEDINASGSPAFSREAYTIGSWWIRSVSTEAAKANVLPPNSADLAMICPRQANNLS
jgi:hypothetical protein